jgi:serine protease
VKRPFGAVLFGRNGMLFWLDNEPRLFKESALLRTRLSLCSWALLMLVIGWVGSAQAAERLAMGLIVKLKDTTPQPVVRLKALAIPKDALSSQRLRMTAASQRVKLSFARHKPTAFGALAVDHGALTTVAKAEAEAARLRADPDVDWVVVNEMEQPMSLSTNDPYYGYQAWMRDLATGGSPNIPAALNRLDGVTLNPVVVAVLDSGVLGHPDLAGRVYRKNNTSPSARGGYDFVSDIDLSRDGDGLDDNADDPGDYVTADEALHNAAFQGCEVRDSEWHGTAVAGQLAAIRGNGIGMVGMLAPLQGTPVMAVRVAGPCGAAVSDIIEGMLWAAGISYYGSPAANPHPARVLTLSFGGSAGCACADTSNLRGADAGECLYQNTVRALTEKGALLVAAAGNGNALTGVPETQAARPASCPGVLAVTALHTDGAKASYANMTPVDSTHFALATLGGDYGDDYIFTTYNMGTRGPVAYTNPYTDPSTDYISVAGTSFATPIAAGTVALMWAVNPNLSPAEILGILRDHGVRPHVSSLSDLGSGDTCSVSQPDRCLCTTSTCGWGVLDVDRAVAQAMIQVPATSYVAPTVTASFFVPERAQPTTKSGGGGSFDGALLAALTVATGLALRSRGRQRHPA